MPERAFSTVSSALFLAVLEASFNLPDTSDMAVSTGWSWRELRNSRIAARSSRFPFHHANMPKVGLVPRNRRESFVRLLRARLPPHAAPTRQFAGRKPG